MFKISPYIVIGFFSSLLGIMSEFFGSIKISYMILMTLILLDTITGLLSAIKYNRISSNGIAKLANKVSLYSLTVLTARLLEIAVLELYATTIITQVTIAYLVIAEVISIFENLTLLGVPLPNNFLLQIIKQFKIPLLDRLVYYSEDVYKKYIEEITNIIAVQIPVIEDKDIQRILTITCEEWKEVSIELSYFIQRHNNNNLLFAKVSSSYQNGLKRIEEKLETEKIPPKIIENFNKRNKHKLNTVMWKSRQVCFSEDKISIKKEKLIEEIITYLYKLIIDIEKER